MDKTEDTVGLLDYSKHKIRLVADSYAEKAYRISSCKREPLTVEWIESMPKNSCFWDIGANVGAYSLIAAKQNNCEMVVACEPHWQNFNHLTKNIILNQMQDKIVPVCIALYDKNQFADLNHREQNSYHFMEAGSSGHQINTFTGESGKDFEPSGTTKSLCLNLDSLTKLYKFQHNYLKIDVDGVENEILQGAKSSLKNNFFESIMVEANIRSDLILKLLESCNYHFKMNGEHDNQFWGL